jgi:hypothetical protein
MAFELSPAIAGTSAAIGQQGWNQYQNLLKGSSLSNSSLGKQQQQQQQQHSQDDSSVWRRTALSASSNVVVAIRRYGLVPRRPGRAGRRRDKHTGTGTHPH